MKKYYLFVVLLFFAALQTGFSQVTNPEELARQELEKRGLEEDEVLKKLEERGIDINTLDPSQLPYLETQLEEIAKELEEEKRLAQEKELEKEGQAIVEKEARELAKKSGSEIEKAVAEGATIEEAIASEVIQQQNADLPEAEVFGQHLYRDQSIRLFSESYDIKPSPDYILGVGDVITIDIWGISEESGTYEISKEGYIKPTRMPRINLKGLSYAKAKELVRKRFSSYYNFRAEEFELAISYSRTIKVNIVGEVINPGPYTISAVNTAFNALAAAGGPSDIGTVRNIQIIGSDGTRKTMDLYEYLLDPAVAQKFYLNENDHIFVEVAKRVVGIQGAIKRPYKYELQGNEQINKLIEYAGGLTDRAYKGNVQVKRFENDQERIIDIDLNELQRNNIDFTLLPGDEVIIDNIPAPFQNFAEVSGAVELPSKYAIAANTKITDLVNKALLKEEAKTDIAFLLRTNADKTIRTIRINLDEALANPQGPANMVLAPKDKLIVLSKSSFRDEQSFVVEGAVREGLEHPYDPGKNLRVSDAVTLANGLRKDAADFGYIFRPSPDNSEKIEYIRVDINSALSNPGSGADILLEPGDRLKVASTLTYSDENFVKVVGAVREPGEYSWDESFKLSDALALAGGLKIEASRSRIDVSRLIFKGDQSTETEVFQVEVGEDFKPVAGGDFYLQPFDQIYVRRAPEFEVQRNVRVDGEFTFPGQHALTKNNERVLSFLDRIGGLTPEAFEQGATLYREKNGVGYVVLDLEKARKNPTSAFNLILQEGDLLNMPKLQGLVTIKGATRASEILPEEVAQSGKVSAPFEKGKNAAYYVENYTAGVSKLGRKRLITVRHPNGELQRAKSFLFFNTYPKVREGSIITVGAKEMKEKREPGEDKDVDWGKLTGDVFAQVSAVLTLILLIERI